MYFDFSLINPNLKDIRFVLGSKSPRRNELIKGLKIPFETIVYPVDEKVDNALPFEDIAISIAQQKANAFSEAEKKNSIIITADTIVCTKNKVLGKPKSIAEAKVMLQELSGKTHQVITGVCLTSSEKNICFSETTEVTFQPLSDMEISYYAEQFKPLDKAGAYGIQEWIGYVAVKEIKGSYNNVIGLPIEKLYQELKNW